MNSYALIHPDPDGDVILCYTESIFDAFAVLEWNIETYHELYIVHMPTGHVCHRYRSCDKKPSVNWKKEGF